MLITLDFSITIDAPAAKVWDTMLDDATYRDWTGVFMPGSYYIGGWEPGDKIQFVASDDKGILSGLSGFIAENQHHQLVSIEYTGFVQNGIEDSTSPEVQEWKGARETYKFTETDGVTELQVSVDTTPEHKEMFDTAWPQAMERLKELSEKE